MLADWHATTGCATQSICVQYLNNSKTTPTFVPNPTGTYGNVGRNAVRGPGLFMFNLSLSRSFKIKERYSLQVRADAFNILNHTSFVGAFAPSGQPAGASYGTLSTGLNSSNFGQITGATNPLLRRARFNRTMRFAATILLAASAFAQSQQQTPQQTGANPPAGREAIFHRAMTMYAAKNYGPALRAFEEAADAGNVEAMMHLGMMYSQGQGTPVKVDEAVAWFRKAAVAGDSQGMCNLGAIYYQGRGVPQRFDLAMKWFHNCAIAGNDQGMFNVGVMYRDGQGVPVDFAEARTWFVKSADAENDKAMNAIGNLYQKGQGVPVDYAEAAKWYHSAANMGNQSAMFNIGVLYEQGLGVPADADEARRWFAKAAEPPTPSRP